MFKNTYMPVPLNHLKDVPGKAALSAAASILSVLSAHAKGSVES